VRFLPLLIFVSLTSGESKPDGDALRQQIGQTLHVPDPLPNLAEKSYGKFNPAKDVAADRVSFATGYAVRVPAIVYHQAGATISRHPALIIVNGHGGDKSSWYAYSAGILYARAGGVVLTYDPIGEFERNWQQRSGTHQPDTPLEPPDLSRRLAGLMITDILQSVRYLAQRSDVDPKNIALVGYEMDSLISSFACGIETSIHACALASDRGTVIYASNAKRGPTLIYNQPLLAGGDQPYFLTKPVALWLLEKLKFPNWTRKQLQSMPESPAPGGKLEVLGSDIPAVPRADLRAIPDAVWTADQDSYVYESWRDRAKAVLK
jgi:hypothetical protein